MVKLSFLRWLSGWRHSGSRTRGFVGRKKPRFDFNMTCSLEVLGTGSSEIAPCVFLSSDVGRFLFNCPESLQTVIMGRSMKLKTFKHAFITRPSWSSVGGLPGMILSSTDLESGHDTSKPLSITGPRGLTTIPELGKVFLTKKGGIEFTPATDELGESTVYSNTSFTVTAVELLGPPLEEEVSDISDSSDDNDSELEHSNKRVKRGTDRISSVVVYVGKFHAIRGKFDTKKAAELGLSPGPQYSTLSKGIPVTTPKGDVIHPHQVIGPDQVGPQFIVLEIPSTTFVSSLVSHPLLQSSQLNPVVIVHMTPKGVYFADEYQKWLKSFSKDTKHILVHPDFCYPEMSMQSCLSIHLPLHMIDPAVFHLPSFVSLPSDNIPLLVDDSSVIIGQNNLVFHMRPAAKLGQVDQSPLKNPKAVIHETLNRLVTSNNGFKQRLDQRPALNEQFKTLLAKSRPSSSHTFTPTALPKDNNSYVTFLGTGSTFPSIYRSASSILLHLSGGEYMLLDAGEGTLNQLYKCFGPHVSNDILSKLKCVFVSHIHGDHSLGVFSILKKRKELFGEPTLVIGPLILYSLLKKYNRYVEKVLFTFQNASTLVGCPQMMPFGISKLQTVPVIHIPQSYGIVLEHKDGWKLVYSGDTRPCSDLIEAGKGSTLLIHEATFNHSLLDDAISKKHTTDVEAMKVAADMGVDFVILTHFSQRYSKYSTAVLEMPASTDNVCVAFDLMTVGINDLKHLQKLTPVIKDNLSFLQ